MSRVASKRAKVAQGAADKARKIRAQMWLGGLTARPLAAFGVDRRRFLALLEVRLLDDLARKQHGAAEGRPQAFAGGFWLTTFLHLMLGVILAGAVATTEAPLAGLTYVFGFVMVFLTITLMAEHAQSLLETNDLAVLGPLPVDGRTVLAARVVHTLVYFLVLLGTLGTPPLVAGAIRFGPWPFAPMFALALVLTTVTSFGLALVLLIGLLRFGGARRVGSLLIFAQIATSLLGFASFQFLPIIMRASTTWLFEPGTPWPWLLPPAHAAALVAATLPDVGPALPGPAALAVAIPLLLLACLAVLARDFQGNLMAMKSADRRIVTPQRRWLRDWLLRDADAIAGYDFAAAMAARERRFKMMAWPPIVMAWFLALWTVWRTGRTGKGGDPRLACMALYILGLTLAQILPIARFADDWQARWLFRANPLRSPAKFTAGAVLALALRFVAPALLLTFAVVLVIARGHLLDVTFATLASGNLVLFGVGLSERGLPFTQKFTTSGQGGKNIARGMLLLLLAGLVAGVQVALSASVVAMLIGIAGAAALLVLQGSVFASRLRRPADVRIDWVEDDTSSGRKRADR